MSGPSFQLSPHELRVRWNWHWLATNLKIFLKMIRTPERTREIFSFCHQFKRQLSNCLQIVLIFFNLSNQWVSIPFLVNHKLNNICKIFDSSLTLTANFFATVQQRSRYLPATLLGVGHSKGIFCISGEPFFYHGSWTWSGDWDSRKDIANARSFHSIFAVRPGNCPPSPFRTD